MNRHQNEWCGEHVMQCVSEHYSPVAVRFVDKQEDAPRKRGRPRKS